MATRSCYIGSVGDSTMLVAVDGVTGHTSFIEMPHVNDIDQVQAHDDSSKVWVRFYGDGATTTEYIGDGQLGNNLAPADASTSPPRVYENIWDKIPTSDKQYRIARDLFLQPSEDNDIYLTNSWTVRNGEGTVLYTNPGDSSRTFAGTTEFIDFGVFGQQDPNTLRTTEISYVNFGPQAGGYTLYSGFMHDNKLCTIRRIMNQQSSQFHNLLLKYSFDGSSLVTFDGFEDLGEAVVDFGTVIGSIIASDNPTDSILIQKNADGTIILYDPINKTLTETGQTLDQYLNESEIFYNWSTVQAYLSDPTPSSYITTPQSSGDGFIQLRDTGIEVKGIGRSLAVTSSFTPPFTDLPNVLAEDVVSWGMSITNMEKSSKFLVMVDYVETSSGTTRLSKALVFDSADLTYSSVVIDTTYTVGVCPQAKVEIEDMAEVQLQAYTISGTVRHEGIGISTQVILIDNTSDMVIGRQISDNTTGAYYFRCWTPGTKSILARHPTTRNFRVVHDVVPVAEG